MEKRLASAIATNHNIRTVEASYIIISAKNSNETNVKNKLFLDVGVHRSVAIECIKTEMSDVCAPVCH